jgi:uncharacterized protein (DUF1697 family)
MDYAIFLRGINTGGLKLEKHDFLAMLRTTGCRSAMTIQAAGTAVIDHAQTPDSGWMADLARQFERHFGRPVPVLIRTRAELSQILELAQANPACPECHQYVLLTDSGKLYDEIAALHQDIPYLPGEILLPGPGCLVWNIPKGETLGEFGGKILGSAQYRQQLTSRNIHTISKALALMVH